MESSFKGGSFLIALFQVIFCFSAMGGQADSVECPADLRSWEKWKENASSKVIGFSKDFVFQKCDNVSQCLARQSVIHEDFKSIRRVLRECPSIDGSAKVCTGSLNQVVSAILDHDFDRQGVTTTGLQFWNGKQGFEATYYSDPIYLNFPDFFSLFQESQLGSASYEKVYSALRAFNKTAGLRDQVSIVRFSGHSFGADEKPEPRLLIFSRSPQAQVSIVHFSKLEWPDGSVRPSFDLEHVVLTASQKSSDAHFYQSKIRGNRFKSELMASPSNCMTCHSGRALGIYNMSTVPAEDLEDARLINSFLRKQKPAKIGGVFDTQFAPSLGSNDPERINARDFASIRRCSQNKIQNPISAQRVANAMNCQTCHNDEPRSRINPFVGGSLARILILKGMMPPNERLEPVERQALLHCLEYEFSRSWTGAGKTFPSIFEEYLREASCR